ncbi:hypothetical protein ACJMK2_015391, partial [Sinanodonta woodiana]
ILIDGALQNLDFSSGSVEFHNLVIERELNQKVMGGTEDEIYIFYMRFRRGIRVGIRLSKKILLIQLEIDSGFRNGTLGLLGTFNDNQNDEFVLPNGTVFISGASQTDQNLHLYGLHWRTQEISSLFKYDGTQSWSSINNLTFVPLFFNPNLTAFIPNATIRRYAQDICYGEGLNDPTPEQRKPCYFDFSVTFDADIANDTEKTLKTIDTAKKTL